jgi:hypothetical protein
LQADIVREDGLPGTSGLRGSVHVVGHMRRRRVEF